jgi:tetratricopeptide (TPR) repeat protein
MRRLLSLAIVVILLHLLVSAQRDAGQRSRLADVIVNVRYDTGQIPPSVKVELYSSTGVPINAAFSDDNGIATLSRVRAGEDYTLRISGDEIETVEQSIELDPRETFHRETVVVRRPRVAANGPGGTVSVSDLNVPGKAQKEFEKGQKALAAKDWRGAAQHYESAIALYPRYATAYRSLGIARIEMGDKAGGQQALEQALAIDGKYAAAHLDLGRLLLLQGNKGEAEKQCNAAVATEPMNIDALTLLASIELQQGELNDAISNAQRVHTLPHPGRAVVHFIAATAMHMQHRDTDAIAEYDLYLQEDPAGPFSERTRAALLALKGKP